MESLITLDKKIFLFIYTKTNSIKLKKTFNFITKLSKPFFITSYLLILFFLYSTNLQYFAISIAKPFSVLIICKLLRKQINRKRPYEIFNNMNLPTKKDASFPSNHTASSFIISFLFFYVNPFLALIMILIASVVSLSRIIVGLHFPLDILFGFLISLSFFLFV